RVGYRHIQTNARRNMPRIAKHQGNMNQFPVERFAVGSQVVLPQRFPVIAGNDDQRIFRQTTPVQLIHQTPDVVVHILHAIVIRVHISQLRPRRFSIGTRSAVRVVYIEIVKEGKKRAIAIAINPAKSFPVNHVGTFANSEGAAIAARALRALIEQSRKAQPSQQAFDQAPVTALEIDSSKLAAVQRADEHVAGGMKVVFEMYEAATEAEVVSKVSAIGGKGPGAVSLLHQGLAQGGQPVGAEYFSSDRRHFPDLVHAVLILISAGQ